ncbi:MAG TPA: tetratricopeptide repeat protein [Waterburya sp.]
MWFVAVFVCLGWILSVCVHEFGHALVAYLGGDTSVKDKGYLTLNPLKYTHPVYSLLLPILFLLMGGIALPGGAVYIERRRLRGRGWESAVSAAGPFASAIVAVLLAIPFWRGLAPLENGNWLWSSLAFLILLEIASVLFNLLPIPPLDGYGLIEPWLPRNAQIQLNKFSKYGIWVVFALFWYVEPLNQFFWNCTDRISETLGVPREMAQTGYILFRQQSNFLILGLIGALWFFRRKELEWYNRGNKFRKLQRYEEAISAYERAINIKSDYYEAWYCKAYLLEQLQRYEEAIASYDRALQIQPNAPDAWTNRGIALEKLQRYQEAIASFDTALQIQAEYPYAWYNKACCYAIQGDSLLAIETLQKAINLDPYQFREQAQTDACFDAIRENPLFKSLIRT